MSRKWCRVALLCVLLWRATLEFLVAVRACQFNRLPPRGIRYCVVIGTMGRHCYTYLIQSLPTVFARSANFNLLTMILLGQGSSAIRPETATTSGLWLILFFFCFFF